jgi:hypothetical protein
MRHCTIYVLTVRMGRGEREREREPRETKGPETHKVQCSSRDAIYKLWGIFDDKVAPANIVYSVPITFKILG